MEEKELRQLFKNLSDCYADTWLDIGIEMQQGEVIQAMTEDRFIETLKEAKLLAAPAVVGRSELLICPHCGKYKRMQGNGIMHQLCECG